jgi:RNA polymerase sigma factor (sigma-70 family)
MPRQDTIDDLKAESRRWRNEAIRWEIQDRLAEGQAPWRDLETLKQHVESAMEWADRRTALTPDQRRLADTNEGLAIGFATTRWRRAKRCGIDFADVVAAAKMGLEDAVSRFDPAKGKLGPFAWNFMLRRVVELHESHDSSEDDEERLLRAVRRSNRWDYDQFAWPEFPDVVRELRRLAATGEATFTDQDLDILELRAGQGKSQIETASLLGITRSAVIRIEKEAAERVGPVAEQLREDSTDRYLLSVLSPDEILRIYGRDSPIAEQRARLEEDDRRRDAYDRYCGILADRYSYGRNRVTEADHTVILG